MTLSLVSYGQSQVTGRVTDENAQGLPGVNVLIKGTSQGTVTDVNGDFKFTSVSPDAVLVISFIGYVTQEIPVGGQTNISTKLVPDAQNLQEVVVVGYGTQKKALVTGAISSVQASQITQTPVLRVEQAMQGRIPGVVVANQSGQPGDAPTVRIRGTGTNGNADPLYIVDGFPVSGIDYLSPGDIESMSVLKDAASSAIYGARGANGVVIITTKKGTRGSALKVSYDGYVGVQNPWKKVQTLNSNQYMMMMNEGAANAGRELPYPVGTVAAHNTDWQDELFNKNAPIASHQLTFMGGGENSMYASTVNYFTQEGIVGGSKSKFDRYSFRINGEQKAGERFTLTNNLTYTQIRRKSIDPNQEFGGLLSNAVNLDPLTPVIETDPALAAAYPANSVLNNLKQPYGISTHVGQEIVNPLARLAVTNGNTKVDKIVANIAGDLMIVKGLHIKTSFGADMGYVTSDSYSPVFYLNAAQQNAESDVSKSTNRNFIWQWENLLTYDKTINDVHFIQAIAGTTAIDRSYEDLTGSKSGLVITDPKNAYINLATNEPTAKANGGANEGSLFSIFGRVNYSYKEKYLFAATVRRDGSSRFGADNPYATFPSVSAGWVISEEDFAKTVPILNYAKVRASWGQNGNENIGGNYPWAATIGTGYGYTFGNTFTGGATYTQVANPNLKWEASEQTDIGVDLQLLDNHIDFTADFYIKDTKDQLLLRPMTANIGSNPGNGPVNGGTVRNRGWEFAINYNGSTSGVRYRAGFNISINKNEVIEAVTQNGAGYSTYGTATRYQQGFPIGYFWGYQTNGIFQNDEAASTYVNKDGARLQPSAVAGDVRFVDRNGDGVINDSDRTMIGNPTPKAMYGFTLSADYKGFDISLFVQGAYGNDIFNGIVRHDLTTSNMPTYALERWTGEGSTNSVPRFSWSDPNGNYTKISDLYIESGSYARIKNLQIGYNFPQSIAKRVGMSKARIYVSGDNLHTFTKYRGFDPEIGARSALDIGIDRGVYPQSRTFRAGVNFTF